MSEKMTSQNELSEIKLVPYQTPFLDSFLASTRENGIPHFLHTRGTVCWWEAGVHTLAFYEVFFQLTKKSTGYKPKKLTGAEHCTHT